MSSRQKYISILSEVEPYIRSEYEVKSLCMFGSVARGQERADSDIDIFVDMPPKALKIIALKQYLQDILGRAVDVVRVHSHLDPYLLNEINRDGITIFAD